MQREKGSMRKSLWSPEEDEALKRYVEQHGSRKWNEVVRRTGLHRCAKSCRLRWMNYLRPGLKLSPFSPLETRILLYLHRRLGNSWSKIALHLPGRTDNDVKNYWHTYARRRRSLKADSLHAAHHRTGDDHFTYIDEMKLPTHDYIELKLPIIIDNKDISISQSPEGHAYTHTTLADQGHASIDDDSPYSSYSTASTSFPDRVLPHNIVLTEMDDEPLPKAEQPTPDGLNLILWKFLNRTHKIS